MLPSERAREKRNAELDAASQPWTKEVDRAARVRLGALGDSLVIDEYSVTHVLKRRAGTYVEAYRLFSHLTTLSPADLIDVIAAVPLVDELYSGTTEEWISGVNEIFRQHRIGYKFVDDELIPFEDDELMQNVIEPTLGLLIGEKFREARASYKEALEEIADGKPGDAMTDAGRALQQTFQALGCEGKMLGPLLRDAKQKGLLGNIDAPLTEGIEKLYNWASANRNELSDAHNSADLLVEDGWLMIHVVGALIQRLAAGTPRQAQPEGQDR